MSDKEPATTDRYRLINEALIMTEHPGGLREFVLHRCQMSWRSIAYSIWDYTGLKVSDVTLASWFADDEEIQQARQPRKATT